MLLNKCLYLLLKSIALPFLLLVVMEALMQIQTFYQKRCRIGTGKVTMAPIKFWRTPIFDMLWGIMYSYGPKEHFWMAPLGKISWFCLTNTLPWRRFASFLILMLRQSNSRINYRVTCGWSTIVSQNHGARSFLGRIMLEETILSICWVVVELYESTQITGPVHELSNPKVLAFSVFHFQVVL